MINSNNKNSKNTTPIKDLSIQNKNIKKFYNTISISIDNVIKKSYQEILKHETLIKNKLPAKCFKHDNILTLYCQKQRIPLCVSCIYYSSQHKCHKIIPLKNASKQILTDSENLKNKLERNIEWIEKIISNSTQNLTNMGKIYPEIKNKIQKNFKSLYNKLVQKQNQQLQKLYQIVDNANKEHTIVIQEYNRLLCFLVQKNNTLNQTESDLILHKRNTLVQIFESLKLPSINIAKIEYLTFANSFNSYIFKQIQNYFDEKFQIKEFPQIISICEPKISVLDFSKKENNLHNEQSSDKISQKKVVSFRNEISDYSFQILRNSNISKKSPSPTNKTKYFNQSIIEKRLTKTPRNAISPKKFFE